MERSAGPGWAGLGMAALMASPAPSGRSSSEASPINAAGEVGSSRKRKAARAWPAEKELLEQLECCICCTPMTGAIYQCMDGHLICAACKPNSTLRADLSTRASPVATPGPCHDELHGSRS